MPAPPATPVASLGRRLGARALDTLLGSILFAIPFFILSSDRLLARVALGVVAVAAYEAGFVVAAGATPGKLIAGIRVAELGHATVEPATAAKRGFLLALCMLVVVSAPLLLLGAIANLGRAGGGAVIAGAMVTAAAVGVIGSVVASPLRRGFPDRVAGTFVVDRRAPAVVMPEELPGYVESRHLGEMTRWGPVATFDQRRRARASRLDGAPLLVLAMLAVAFAGSVEGTSGPLLAVLAALWVVLFVADETWRISRYGGTAGHRRYGLAVVDIRTGEPPGPGRSFLRAVLVALPLYVLPAAVLGCAGLAAERPLMLVPAAVAALLLVGWVLWTRSDRAGRSLHDLAAGTVVVAPPSLRRTGS